MNMTIQLRLGQEMSRVLFVSFCFNKVDVKCFLPCKEQIKGTI